MGGDRVGVHPSLPPLLSSTVLALAVTGIPLEHIPSIPLTPRGVRAACCHSLGCLHLSCWFPNPALPSKQSVVIRFFAAQPFGVHLVHAMIPIHTLMEALQSSSKRPCPSQEQGTGLLLSSPSHYLGYLLRGQLEVPFGHLFWRDWSCLASRSPAGLPEGLLRKPGPHHVEP